MLIRHYLSLLLLASAGMAQADETMKKKLEALLPGVKIESIQPLDDTGLYEVLMNGDILYFTKDAKYAIQGDIISLKSRENLTEKRRTGLRKQALAHVNEKDMIIYTPKKTDYTVTVFTDIDCGYCRKLHSQIKDYNALGIRIRYMAFPRAGLDSRSYDKAVNVWCAKDRHQAITDAKNGLPVLSDSCDAPIKAQYLLGQRLGVTGTPAIFTEDGQLIPGYVPPKQLRALLDKKAKTSK